MTMLDATPNLLPCPFCGSADDDNDLRRVIDGEWENAWIECDRCGAQGPHVAMQQLPIDNISDEDFIKAKRLVDAEASAAAIAAWNQRNTWQPIETAPRDGTWVLLAGGECEFNEESDNKGRTVTARWTNEFSHHDTSGCWQFAYYDSGCYGEYENPIHWQPLPSPPPITP
jgi:Lar family restriction alleviation protein